MGLSSSYLISVLESNVPARRSHPQYDAAWGYYPIDSDDLGIMIRSLDEFLGRSGQKSLTPQQINLFANDPYWTGILNNHAELKAAVQGSNESLPEDKARLTRLLWDSIEKEVCNYTDDEQQSLTAQDMVVMTAIIRSAVAPTDSLTCRTIDPEEYSRFFLNTLIKQLSQAGVRGLHLSLPGWWAIVEGPEGKLGGYRAIDQRQHKMKVFIGVNPLLRESIESFSDKATTSCVVL